jgi:hypothetical protein
MERGIDLKPGYGGGSCREAAVRRRALAIGGGDVGAVKAAVEVDAAGAGRVGKVLLAHISLDLTTRLKISLTRPPVR